MRLDFWLMANNLCVLVMDTDIMPAMKTDHTAICLTFGEIGLRGHVENECFHFG